MFALDIAIYHIFCQHNPYKMSQVRQDRYDRAIEWLKGVMKGDITIADAPRLPEEDVKANSRWQMEYDEVRPVLE
jgi:phage gp36-like protein